MKRVLLPVSVFAARFEFKTVSGLAACQYLIENMQKTGVVHVGVCNEDAFFHGIVIRKNAAEQLYHFLLIECISAVNEQDLAEALNDHRAASAGRLYRSDLRVIRYGIFSNSRAEVGTSA